MDVLNASIYVGTYKKYNNGNLFGKWVCLSEYKSKDDFIEACLLLHSDEKDPELMFQDWENIPECYISQDFISENVFKIINNVPENELDAFMTYIDLFGEHDFFSDYQKFQMCYNGYFDDKEAFAQHIISKFYNVDNIIKYYFNYADFADDLFRCDYTMQDGFVFSII